MCDRAFGNPPTIGHLFGHTTGSGSGNSTLAAAAAALAAAGSSASSLAGESFAGAAASSYAAWVPDSLLHSTNLGWLLNGQVLMVLMTICAVYPLSCQKHMRSLEGAAGAGLLIMVGLCGLLGFKAWSQGWPAIADGEFPLWSLRVRCLNELDQTGLVQGTLAAVISGRILVCSCNSRWGAPTLELAGKCGVGEDHLLVVDC
jgi:hypothetical protein